MPPRRFVGHARHLLSIDTQSSQSARSGWHRTVMPAWHAPSATVIPRTLESDCKMVCGKGRPSSHSISASGPQWRERSEAEGNCGCASCHAGQAVIRLHTRRKQRNCPPSAIRLRNRWNTLWVIGGGGSRREVSRLTLITEGLARRLRSALPDQAWGS